MRGYDFSQSGMSVVVVVVVAVVVAVVMMAAAEAMAAAASAEVRSRDEKNSRKFGILKVKIPSWTKITKKVALKLSYLK